MMIVKHNTFETAFELGEQCSGHKNGEPRSKCHGFRRSALWVHAESSAKRNPTDWPLVGPQHRLMWVPNPLSPAHAPRSVFPWQRTRVNNRLSKAQVRLQLGWHDLTLRFLSSRIKSRISTFPRNITTPSHPASIERSSIFHLQLTDTATNASHSYTLCIETVPAKLRR